MKIHLFPLVLVFPKTKNKGTLTFMRRIRKVHMQQFFDFLDESCAFMSLQAFTTNIQQRKYLVTCYIFKLKILFSHVCRLQTYFFLI